jgi:hypothetical protein
MDHFDNNVIDGATAAVLVTAPLWLQLLEQWGQASLILLGLVLALLRVGIAWRELRTRRGDKAS